GGAGRRVRQQDQFTIPCEFGLPTPHEQRENSRKREVDEREQRSADAARPSERSSEWHNSASRSGDVAPPFLYPRALEPGGKGCEPAIRRCESTSQTAEGSRKNEQNWRPAPPRATREEFCAGQPRLRNGDPREPQRLERHFELPQRIARGVAAHSQAANRVWHDSRYFR